MITKEVSINAVRPFGLHAGDSLRVLEENEESVMIEIVRANTTFPTVQKRGSAGAWALAARGSARYTEGESRDDARMAYYREKYGVK